jgi:putative membrane-bound dehydrogenase-like protein
MRRPAVVVLLFLLTWTNLAPGQDKPIPPDQAAARMKVPDGFRVSLVAGEPQLVKPIALTTDDRGRLWVVESHAYPHWKPDGKGGNDRILIFEDKNGDGHFSAKVFWDKGTNLSGIAWGFGGVWLCATPNLLFVPVRPGEDKRAGEPVVVLDGWNVKTKHNVFNNLHWGPDGWLYGCNGIQSESRVGRPGTPDAQRIPINCGVWRYHPARKKFEALAHGTTNPWGLDFDDYGELFITNCVIKHLFHVVPGAHFVRMYGQDLNRYCFDLMPSCADHIHWGGGNWTTSRGGKGEHDKPGGGHAHAGALVYLGDNWPAEYRNHVFMCNLHGNRVNQDILERRGSGYVAHHGKDFLLADDSWFRGLSLHTGPDGGVFVSDWHDTGECHNYDKVHPSGRIYKVTFGRPAAVAVDVAKLSDQELVKLQLHKNDWWVRRARRLLQERAHAGKLGKTVRPLLLKMLSDQKDVTRKLRALWALHVIGETDNTILRSLWKSPHDVVRGWAVRLFAEPESVDKDAAYELMLMAEKEKSPAVRLALASGLQRLPRTVAWTIAEELTRHAEDAADPNLPLMIWYGIERLLRETGAENVKIGTKLLPQVRIPLVRQYIARRIALMAEGGKEKSATKDVLAPLVRLLAASADGEVQRDMLRGMLEALQGRRDVYAPQGWSAAYTKLAASKDAEVREKALVLSVLFGDPQALAALRKTAADPKADTAARRRALETLVEKRANGMLPLLGELLADRAMRGPALRGLAEFNDPETPTRILGRYASFSDADKADAVATLASRPAYARALLEAMAKGRVPRRDLSPFIARQILGLKDKEITARLNQVWGSIRATAKDRSALLARYKALVTPAALKKADRSHGRLLFDRTCASCHLLFDAGGKIGPELTGSQRTNPEYILTKVLDPNAVVPSDYQVTRVTTTGGRVITGIIKEETEKTIAVQTPTEIVRLPKGDIDERTRLAVSLMPEGQLTPLSDTEIRDLIAYLAGAGQVPLPKQPKASR